MVRYWELEKLEAEEAKAAVPASASEEGRTAKGKEKASGSHVDQATSPISPIADAARRLFSSTLGAATGARAVQSELFSKDFYARTASTFLTGFFLGTFITLCMLSPQRREIANHFT